ncbi:hypothetical protein K7X08_004333 [Anisodus acutangulus]|uniref:Uncharacterized protein n=1 Tax=Anisodus acutangulus TaxID=402998 RepID=A0A9Q1MHB3_9SOLA|nr:hypothetical protein K7X08_004333 [Anisodus acutangulus]
MGTSIGLLLGKSVHGFAEVPFPYCRAGHFDINLVVEKWSFVKKDDQVLTGGGDLQSASPAIRSLSVTFQIFRKYDDDNKLPLSYAFHHWPFTSYIIFISSDHDV